MQLSDIARFDSVKNQKIMIDAKKPHMMLLKSGFYIEIQFGMKIKCINTSDKMQAYFWFKPPKLIKWQYRGFSTCLIISECNIPIILPITLAPQYSKFIPHLLWNTTKRRFTVQSDKIYLVDAHKMVNIMHWNAIGKAIINEPEKLRERLKEYLNTKRKSTHKI